MTNSLQRLKVTRFKSQGLEEEPKESSYLETHDLLFAPLKRKIKTYKEVEIVLRGYNWRPMSNKPQNGWVDYLYDINDEIQPIARLPAPPAPQQPSPCLDDSWQDETFRPSLECVAQFVDWVNKITKDGVFELQPKVGVKSYLNTFVKKI